MLYSAHRIQLTQSFLVDKIDTWPKLRLSLCGYVPTDAWVLVWQDPTKKTWCSPVDKLIGSSLENLGFKQSSCSEVLSHHTDFLGSYSSRYWSTYCRLSVHTAWSGILVAFLRKGINLSKELSIASLCLAVYVTSLINS